MALQSVTQPTLAGGDHCHLGEALLSAWPPSVFSSCTYNVVADAKTNLAKRCLERVERSAARKSVRLLQRQHGRMVGGVSSRVRVPSAIHVLLTTTSLPPPICLFSP